MPQTLLFIPLAQIIRNFQLGDTPWALILIYPTFLIPFCTWLMMGYFKTIPKELEECARIDGASRWKAMVCISSVRDARHPVGRHLRLHAVVERVHLRPGVPVLARAEDGPGRRHPELIRGDVFFWGPLMAGALLGSMPVAIVYSFFVEHYVAGPDRLGEGIGTMAEVTCTSVNKKFDDIHAVKDVDLEIRDKEFMVFVGPSGCGKTTTLRMID